MVTPKADDGGGGGATTEVVEVSFFFRLFKITGGGGTFLPVVSRGRFWRIPPLDDVEEEEVEPAEVEEV